MPRDSVTRTASPSRGRVTDRPEVTGRSSDTPTSTGSSPIVTDPPPEEPASAYLLAAPSVADLSHTQVRITVPMSEPCQLWIEYGTTTGYGSETTHETSFTYSTHAQTISGLTAETGYHYRIIAVNQGGITYTSADYEFTTIADPALPSIDYTDYSLVGVTSYGGSPIDATGVVDSTAGLNAWIAAQPNGSNATTRARYIFPPTATYKITTGLCFGNKSYVTVWGHAATTSAWLPGDDTVYDDLGCTISFGTTVGANTRSCFMPGHTYRSAGSVNYGQTCTDLVIRGFNIDGNATTPGIFNGSAETVSAFEVGKVVGLEVRLNKMWDIPGDGIRFRGDSTTCDDATFELNWVVSCGRNGSSHVEGDNQIVQDNVFDRCGYYGMDVEPDDDSTLAYRIISNVTIRRNTYGSFGSASVAGTFAALANGTHVSVSDISVTDNVVTGSTFGLYPTTNQHRGLGTYIGQNTPAGTTGQAPRLQRVTVSRNVALTGTQAGPIIRAGSTDTLTVEDNDGNLSSGVFLNSASYLSACTSVTQSGNT